MKKLKLSLFISLLIIEFFFACNSFDPFGQHKGLESDDAVKVASQTIPVAGGSVIVNSPGSSIDGMVIKVPENSYPGARDFEIYTAEITSHDLGEYFNPITPLIMIDNEGGYADSLMEITIPISLPEGYIPIGFYYDDVDDELEAIPVLDYTSSSITLLTRHFSPAADLKPERVNSKSDDLSEYICQLMISSMLEDAIYSQGMIETGFKVGIDDWEFRNWGSYIAPFGHCTGQNLAAMWYYYEQKLKGQGQLHNKYSTNSNMWEDNNLGYRFCSVLQKDISTDGIVNDFFWEYIDFNQGLDQLKFMALAGAMLTTGEPQGVGVFRETGKDNNGKPVYAGHDLICYKVSILQGILYIADPNYPGIEKTITFKDGRFDPYQAKLNANADPEMFPFVTWYAKTACIDWSQIGKRFNELENGTIGTVAPNAFPEYSIKVIGNWEHVIENNYATNNNSLTFYVECPDADEGHVVNGITRIGLEIFNEDGELKSVYTNDGECKINLEPGENKLGFYIYGYEIFKDDNGNIVDVNDLYIDYCPIEIQYGESNEIGAVFEELHKCKQVTVSLQADFQTKSTDEEHYRFYGPSISVTNEPLGQLDCIPIKWNGNAFSVDFDYSLTDGVGKLQSTRKGSIRGEFSTDGKTLISIDSEVVNWQASGNKEETTKLTFSNIPHKHTETYSLEGPEIEAHVESWEFKYDFDYWGERQTLVATGINYNNTDFNYLLFVYFE
ncbi:MAG: hypothetical protein JW798_06175 [Prolixibacteraceae bacterium]|nr:hypothetical protein [Prolixibacteraceae bacterium]